MNPNSNNFLYVQSKKRGKKAKVLFGLFFIALVWFFFGRELESKQDSPARIEGEILAIQRLHPIPGEIMGEFDETVQYTISEGDIPADVFSEYGRFDANSLASLLESAEDVYDFTNIKIGKNIRFSFSDDQSADRVEYDRDTEAMIIVERTGDDFEVREEKINYVVSQEVVNATINNFFYLDALNAGVSESTVLEISDIFSFGIDFTTEIQKGDEFKIIYEKRKRDGKEGPDGRILAAKFINNGKSHYAYYFDNEGGGGHYDNEGRFLVRQFLKAPLSYRRITSGFTGVRRHPITKRISAHYQIDYSAPRGTVVVSTARGTVVSAGWEGGWGYIVRLKHDNGYTTHYAHLSGFAKSIRSGTRVNQGQIVGYVGTTGYSTGYHLDYGMRLNGSPVNPLSLDLPKGKPLSPEKMGEFGKIMDKYNEILK